MKFLFNNLPLLDNPVFDREFRRRFRGPGFLLGWVLGYIILLSIVVGVAGAGLYFFSTISQQMSQQMPFGKPQIGDKLNSILIAFQGWFFFFTIPGFSAAAITTEKEKKTLHMMIITSMTPTDIMLGKIAGIFIFISILILTSVPISILTFLFGNVSIMHMILGYVSLFLGVLYYVGCGIGASGMCQKTSTATMISYGLIAAMFFATSVVPLFTFRILQLMTSSRALRFWTEIYPWIILTIKVTAGLALLYFGWYKIKHFELTG